MKVLKVIRRQCLINSKDWLEGIPVAGFTPSLFNYGHVYHYVHYALEFLPTFPGKQNCKQKDEDEDITSGIGRITDRPFPWTSDRY